MAFINVGFGTKIYLDDTPTLKWHVSQIANCDYKITAESTPDLNKIVIGSAINAPCPNVIVKVTQNDSVIAAIVKLQCEVDFILNTCCGGGGGGGTVTNVSANNLNPLFTTSVATPTTTPVISFAQISQNQNLVFASPDGAAGDPIFRPLVVNDISNPKNITSSDGSVILGGTPIGSVLQSVDLTVNPAILVVSRPDTEIFFGTGTSYSSNPNWTYNDHLDNGGFISNKLTMLDPNTGNTLLLVQSDDLSGTGTSNFILTADNLFSTGAYAIITGDISGRIQLAGYASASERGAIDIIPLDATYLHGIHIRVDGKEKSQFSATSLDLRTADATTYQLRFYEYNSGVGTNYVGFQAPAVNLAGNVIWSLPTTDSTGTQALVSDGAGNLSWSNFVAGSPALTATQIAFGSGANLMTSSASLTWNDATKILTVAGTTISSVQDAFQLNPFGVAAGNTGEIRFLELAASGTNYVGFKAPDALAGNLIWKLPTTDSTGTQALVSNGSLALSWVTIPSAFSLSNGNGTTANGTAVDLGGNLSANTSIVLNGNTLAISGTNVSLAFDDTAQTITLVAPNGVFADLIKSAVDITVNAATQLNLQGGGGTVTINGANANSPMSTDGVNFLGFADIAAGTFTPDSILNFYWNGVQYQIPVLAK